jgi:hypothetical protein
MNELLQQLSTRQIRNLIKIATTDTYKFKLREELTRREKERHALFTHEQRGRERAKAEGRLRNHRRET